MSKHFPAHLSGHYNNMAELQNTKREKREEEGVIINYQRPREEKCNHTKEENGFDVQR